MPITLGTRSGSSFFDDVDDADHDDAEPRPHRRGRRAVAALAATGLLVGLVSALLPASASADPSANDWYRLRMCESSDNYRTNTGNGHYGAYQFDLATWRSVGGAGYPNLASPTEQDGRALILYQERGWQPWQCATTLGLTGSAGSTDHGWPGSYYYQGEDNAQIARWQKQMRSRGAPLTGTGQFGPITLSVVEQLQTQNGLPAEATLGPLTWGLAWTGSYHPAGTASKSGAPRPTAPGATAPKWPGTYYSVGDWNSHIAAFQKQLRSRGAPLTGTGQFGPRTEAVVKALQRQNGLDPVGFIGPNTWKLAWTGHYRS